MPLYEYECQSCGERVEVLQRVGAPAIGGCDACGGEMMRLLSAPAFQFKGTGWYVTDYAKKNSPPAGESQGTEDGSKSKSKKSSDAKSESKNKATKESSDKKTPASS